MVNYTHLELNKDIEALAGYYTPLKEVKMQYNDRELLYVVGQVVVDSSCCGFSNTGYVIVPGFIINWKSQHNQNGLPVSEVEPVLDKAEQIKIRKVIKDSEYIPQIEFWQ